VYSNADGNPCHRRLSPTRIELRPLFPEVLSRLTADTSVPVDTRHSHFCLSLRRCAVGGGWASYLRARVAKSHDIDIIVDHATLSLEGATVGDYERRVNEVLTLAFQLRARRREARSRKSTIQLPLIPDPT
jgi:hypothetical protein